MNAMMRIRVRLINEASREAQRVKRDLDNMKSGWGGAAGAGDRFHQVLRGNYLEKYGKNLQWTGRQLTYNFTLPLMAAGTAGVKFAMDNERAMTQLRKVYSGLDSDIPKLADAFTALSNIFGVHQDEVIGIGAAWASAGASGIAVARNTRSTLEAMIIGNLDSAAATEALISIQAQYNLSSKDLVSTLETLNQVENITATTMGDLIVGFQKSAGTASAYGVTVLELAADIAALTPAAGSAEQAGNSLKTMFSRLMAPTKATSDVLALMGINMGSADWQSKTAQERLVAVAEATDKLTTAQKANVSAVVASRWNINKFDILVGQITGKIGFYQRALDGASDAEKNHLTYVKELGTYLSSSPQAFSIMWNQLRNAMAEVIMPLIPAILALVSKVVALVDAFTNLSPATQQLVLLGLVALAAVGPVVQYFGAVITLVSKVKGALFILGDAFVVAGKLAWFLGLNLMKVARVPFTLIGNAISGLIGMIAGIPAAIAGMSAGMFVGIIVAVVAFVFIFRKQIASAIEWLADNWREVPRMWADGLLAMEQRLSGFPKVVLGVFISVLRIIKAAALAAYEWLSYLNPFAHHSPSLVEQVTAGVDVIARQFASLSNIGQVFRQAITDLETFKSGVSEFTNAMATLENAKTMNDITATAGPGAAAAYAAMGVAIDRVRVALDAASAAYARQSAVVDAWKAKLDAANATLDAATAKLEVLSAAAAEASAALQDAQANFDALANTPIAGMQASSDAIFANQMAQKQLQLQILQTGKASEETGQAMKDAYEEAKKAYGDAQDQIASLNGDIEMMRGQAQDLRLAGAASDVLAPIEAQVAAMEAAKQALATMPEPVEPPEPPKGATDALQEQMAELQKQGEILQLQNDLTFDPMQRQIDAIINSSEEMTFEDLLQALKDAKADVERLTGVEHAANIAMDDQQGVVDALTIARDNLNTTYEAEQEKLDQLGDVYDSIERQINDMESAMADFAQMASQAMADAKAAADEAAKLSPAEQAFIDAGAGDFDPATGTGMLPETGDIEALAEQWANEAKTMFGNFDLFEPLRDGYEKAWQWVLEKTPDWVKSTAQTLKNTWESFFNGEAKSMFTGIFGDDAAKGQGEGLRKKIDEIIASVKQSLSDFWNWLKDSSISGGVIGFMIGAGAMVSGILPTLKRGYVLVKDFVVGFGSMLADEFENWKPMLGKLVETFRHIFNVVGRLFAAFGVIVAVIWRTLWPVLIHVLKPIFDFITNIVKAALQIIRGVIEFILNLINGDWDLLWGNVLTIVDGVWDAIYSIFSGAIGVVVGFVRGLVDGVISAFQWLYDVLVGHSIIPDMVNLIIVVFKFLWDNLVKITGFIVNAIKWAWEKVITPVFAAVKWYIENVLIPVFKFLWPIVRDVFQWIGDAIKFAWENVIKPAWELVKWYVENVLVPVFTKIWDTVKDVWEKVSNAITWAWNVVIQPLFEGIKRYVNETLIPLWNPIKDTVLSAFRGIRDTVGSIWEGIGNAIAGGINLGISAVNILIDGLNAVARILPGLDFNIPHLQPYGGGSVGAFSGLAGAMPQFATGTAHLPRSAVGAGFRTNGPRAIVGEGRVGYPEYVVPTDPRYRSNANRLTSELVKDISFGFGGIPNPISTVTDLVGDVAGVVQKGAAMAAFAPFNLAADALINQIGWDIPREITKGGKDAFYNWAKGTDAMKSGGILRKSVPSFATGGSFITKPKPGGHMINVGEAGQAEKITVTPLTSLERESGGTVNNFYGDMVFPNVRDASDAGEFLDKLRGLSD